MKLKEAKLKYLEAKKAYYSGSPVMSDATFDRLESWIASKDPEWKPLHETGVKVGKKREVKLAHFMPSLGKRYEDIDEWFTSHPRHKWSYMAKLDGSSVLLTYKKGKPFSLVTRGNGEFGKDISYFLPYLETIPKKISVKDEFSVRCEAIVKRDVFESKWNSEFDAPRNMVSGILNRQTVHPALSDIHFVVLGVYGEKQYDGLQQAFSLGFETVYCRKDFPREHKKYYDIVRAGQYEADGVVICNPDWTYEYESSEKPKDNIIAYKENVEFADTTVVDVIYQVSHNGRIIPKIQVEPVTLAGATISYCTSHNAQWMLDHKIGKNAKVRITRSGDVIPKIIDVLEAGEILYPKVEWKMKGVHFVATEVSREQQVKIITRFISVLGVETVKRKTIDTLYGIGVTSIRKLLQAIRHPKFEKKLKEILGPKKGSQVYSSLLPLIENQFSISDLMIATSSFDAGVGKKRLLALQEQDFDLLELSKWEEGKIKYSIMGPGIGEATAELIAHGLNEFKCFWKKNSSLMQPPLGFKKRKVIKGKLSGVTVAFTGYRSKEQEQLIESLGGTVTGFTAKTDVLLFSETGRKSSKIEKAGNKAMTFSRFKEKYEL